MGGAIAEPMDVRIRLDGVLAAGMVVGMFLFRQKQVPLISALFGRFLNCDLGLTHQPKLYAQSLTGFWRRWWVELPLA